MNLRQLYDDLAQRHGSRTGEMVFTFSDKGSMHSYIEFYENYFQHKRDSVTLLEIGMMTGGSLHLWQKYFERYQLVGMDISPSWNAKRDFQQELEKDSNITLLFGINSRSSAVPELVRDLRFDFIIDDGDHSAMAQMETFENYWPLTAESGTYFIEDVIGPVQIESLRKFLDQYQQKHSVALRLDHYRGFKNSRADDQILAISREKNL
jgi:hypothetical protein